MTAETLKPFITPSSAVNNFPAKHSGVTQPKRKIKHLVPIVLCIIAVALVIGIFGLTIWQTTRVQRLESDLACLKREVESLRKRLGINYLEDMNEFQKEYTNMLIQDPSKLDDIDGENEDYDDDEEGDYPQRPSDDDDDEDDLVIGEGDDDMDDDSDEDAGNERTTDYDEYLDMIQEEKNSSIIKLPKNKTETENASSSSVSNDDNVFEDFTNYDSKKKAQRKSRSIELRNELQSNDVPQGQNLNQNRIRNESRLEQALKESSASAETLKHRTNLHRHRQLRPHSRQARQRLLVRKGESPVSARSGDTQPDSDSGHYVPAAHFHLTDKIDHSSHQLYIGKETANTDTKWKRHFSYNRGHLRVIQPGLYYVYAQICYENPYDENGFVIYHENKPFLNCLNTVPTNMRKLHTCHTSGLIQLKENESIQLRPLLNHEDHKEILREDNNRSYIGIIKLHGQV